MNRRSFLTQSSLAALSLTTLPDVKPFAPKFVGAQTSTQDIYRKILFLGDSITQAGDYINFFECQVRIARPETSIEIYNLGLGSETISGLSEDNHPYPRPYLHNRLDKVLDFVQPDLIFACYGINCGIYHPFSEQRFEQYQQGVRKLMDKAKQAQAELILLTPPPYASTIDDRTKARADNNRNDYSYAKPYKAYDDVMRKYAEWIMSIHEVQSIDIQTPMRKFKDLCYGQDVIHPNPLGHQLMAHTILGNYKEVNPSIQDAQWNWSASEVRPDQSRANIKQFTTAAPELNHIVLSDDASYNKVMTSGQSFISKITDCPSATYQLYDNNYYLGQYNHEDLQKGIVIAPLSNQIHYQHLSFVKRARQLYDLVAAKRESYDYALLQHIGHERPMHKKGLPLILAEEKKKAIESEISNILRNTQWELEAIQIF